MKATLQKQSPLVHAERVEPESNGALVPVEPEITSGEIPLWVSAMRKRTVCIDPVTGAPVSMTAEEWMVPTWVYVLLVAVVLYFVLPNIPWMRIIARAWTYVAPYVKSVLSAIFAGG